MAILPQSPLISEGIEEGSKMNFLKNMKNHIIQYSSMLLQTRSIWGRIIMKCLNFKTSRSQLSNARFPESFGLKFANLHKFEIFHFFSKFRNFMKNHHFLKKKSKICRKNWKFEKIHLSRSRWIFVQMFWEKVRLKA